MDCPPICHGPTSSPIVTQSPLVSTGSLRLYKTCYPFARGSLIVLMMKAVRTSETSVNINFNTRRYIPEDSKLHTRCRENLKSHILSACSALKMETVCLPKCLHLHMSSHYVTTQKNNIDFFTVARTSDVIFDMATRR
jgi:hypothetical protein